MLASLLAVSLASAPVVVVPGESIAGVRVGMTKAEVAERHPLVPEGVERAERTGFRSGPLLFLFDPQGRVVLISVELQRTGGLRVGKVRIPPKISAAAFAKALPGCTVSPGSGGNAVHCEPGLDAYDSHGDQHLLWVHLGPG